MQFALCAEAERAAAREDLDEVVDLLKRIDPYAKRAAEVGPLKFDIRIVEE